MGFFNIHSVAKHQKIEGVKFFYFREKISQCRKKLKGGTLWDFSTSILPQNSKKMKGALWGKNFSEKSRSAEKKLKGVTLWSRPVWYVTRENRKNPFWFSSLGQMVQFGAIIFCRIFKNYSGQFVWIEKKNKSHYNSRVYFMKRRLKIIWLIL